jgi:hypothetical protein
MSIYRILSKSNISPKKFSDEDSALIKEKFSWFAFLLPPFWAIEHGLWIELALIIASFIGLGFAGAYISSEGVFWLYILGVFWLGYEASSIRAYALRRKGYISNGDLIASNEEQAQVSWIKHRIKNLKKLSEK